MRLSLEGHEEHGIVVSQTTTLDHVRSRFPVPSEYVFGVPAAMEASLRAADFLPLMLLRKDECLKGNLAVSQNDGHTKARKRLEAEVTRLRRERAQAQEEMERAQGTAEGLHAQLTEARAQNGQAQAVR